jgi:hypothetical protein
MRLEAQGKFKKIRMTSLCFEAATLRIVAQLLK